MRFGECELYRSHLPFHSLLAVIPERPFWMKLDAKHLPYRFDGKHFQALPNPTLTTYSGFGRVLVGVMSVLPVRRLLSLALSAPSTPLGRIRFLLSPPAPPDKMQAIQMPREHSFADLVGCQVPNAERDLTLLSGTS